MICRYCKIGDHSKHKGIRKCMWISVSPMSRGSFCSCRKYICSVCLAGDHSDRHNNLGFCTRRDVYGTEQCGCRYVKNERRDIWEDICDPKPNDDLEGNWQRANIAGSCMSCGFQNDNLVFSFKMRGWAGRLCEKHLKELVELARYKPTNIVG